jgi:ADP-heptose:LPS heptosyltransferase
MERANYSRILLTRMKFIGDIVLTTPLIRTLRDTFPNSYIAYLGDAQAVSLLEHNPFLNEIIGFDFTGFTSLRQFGLFFKLYARRFDVAIDLFCNPRSALLTFATRAKVRVGGDLPGRGKLYTVRVQDNGSSQGAIDFHYQSLEAIGIRPIHYKTEIFLTDLEKDKARSSLQQEGIDFSRPIVALHSGGTWPSKIWDAEKFAALADMLVAKLGAQVLLTAGPGDLKIIGKVNNKSTRGHLRLPVMPLRHLAANLFHCSVFVSNDCGPMHIAVAVGVPTIGIFGPGEENIWFPYTPEFSGGSSKNIALRKNVSCHPCHLNVCNRLGEDNMECMKLLTVDEVFKAVKERV